MEPAKFRDPPARARRIHEPSDGEQARGHIGWIVSRAPSTKIGSTVAAAVASVQTSAVL